MYRQPYSRSIRGLDVFNSTVLMREIVGWTPSLLSTLQRKTGLTWYQDGEAITASSGDWTFVVKTGELSIGSEDASHASNCTDQEVATRVVAFLRNNSPRFKRLLREKPIQLADEDPRIISAKPVSGATLIARADWSQHELIPDSIYPGATWTVYGGVCSKVDDYFRIQYPDTTPGGTVPGGMSAGVALQLDSSVNTANIFTKFEARLPFGMVGPKFYKVHGDNGGVDYANTTYQLSSGTGNMDAIGFGDGVDTGNDVTNAIYLDGANETWTGRNYGLATIQLKSTPASFVWDSNWHTFEIGHGYNSGTSAETERNDGFFTIIIDGIAYLRATNVFNRHYLNARRVNMATFGDWVQNDLPAEVHFRNIECSIGGFISG